MKYSSIKIAVLTISVINVIFAQSYTECSITVKDNYKKFNELLLGSNINWTDEADGLYNPTTKNFREPTFSLVQDLSLKIMRFPGGLLSEDYNWQQGIGAAKFRGKGFTLDRKAQTMIFGTNEFLALCGKENYVPIVTLSSNESDLTTNIEWVRYCNQLSNSNSYQRNSIKSNTSYSVVKYWEIGNEVYLQNKSIEFAAKYIRYALQLSKKIKEIQPDAEIGVVVTGEDRTWDSVVVSLCNSSISFLSYHAYYVSHGKLENEITNALRKIQNEIENISSLIAKYNAHLKIAVTEYNLFPSNGITFENKEPSIAQAIFMFGCINLFVRENIILATKWVLASPGKLYFADILKSHTSDPIITPTYVFQKEFNNVRFKIISDVETYCNGKIISLAFVEPDKKKTQIWLANTSNNDTIKCVITSLKTNELKFLLLKTMSGLGLAFQEEQLKKSGSTLFVIMKPLTVSYVTNG